MENSENVKGKKVNGKYGECVMKSASYYTKIGWRNELHCIRRTKNLPPNTRGPPMHCDQFLSLRYTDVGITGVFRIPFLPEGYKYCCEDGIVPHQIEHIAMASRKILQAAWCRVH